MTRRIKRHKSFELVLQIKDDGFIRPPRDSQRNWLLNKAMDEFAQQLGALDKSAARFVAGAEPEPIADRIQAPLSDYEIMEDWQIPIMRAMAGIVTEKPGDVLEIGFGRGVSADFVQAGKPRSHTIIECNHSIIERCEHWRQKYPDAGITIIPGLWQDVLDDLGQFDAILFHTYPLNQEEMLEQIGDSVTFADHFFAHAAAHLNPGGVFTYLSNEIDSLGRSHQRLLFRHFNRIEISVVRQLDLPQNVRDAWWADSMAIVKAVR